MDEKEKFYCQECVEIVKIIKILVAFIDFMLIWWYDNICLEN